MSSSVFIPRYGGAFTTFSFRKMVVESPEQTPLRVSGENPPAELSPEFGFPPETDAPEAFLPAYFLRISSCLSLRAAMTSSRLEVIRLDAITGFWAASRT